MSYIDIKKKYKWTRSLYRTFKYDHKYLNRNQINFTTIYITASKHNIFRRYIQKRSNFILVYERNYLVERLCTWTLYLWHREHMYGFFSLSPVLTRHFSPQDLNKSGVPLECRTTTKFINLWCKRFWIGTWPKCIVIMYMLR